MEIGSSRPREDQRKCQGERTMDEKSSQIIDEIATTRDKLGDNLNDLESRMRQATDCRTYYERHPLMLAGAALGCGFLFSKAFSAGNSGSTQAQGYESSRRTK